jgi:hypothetical protein
VTSPRSAYAYSKVLFGKVKVFESDSPDRREAFAADRFEAKTQSIGQYGTMVRSNASSHVQSALVKSRLSSRASSHDNLRITMVFKTIDFPEAILETRDRGDLVLFAGAGVSMPPPSSLPSFDLKKLLTSADLCN